MNDPKQSEAQAPAEAPFETPAADAIDATLVAAQAKVEENWNLYLRTVAEMENFRKRSERELENARKFAVERFAQDLVSVADALEAATSAASAGGAAAHLEGIQATLRQLYRAFEKAGIQVIDPAGKTFDPAWHEAMVVRDTGAAPPNTVLEVVQKGYSLNGRLLRPARVVVSRDAEPGAAGQRTN